MTNTQVSTFTFPVTDNTVRTFTSQSGTPWFVAADVCDVLGLKPAPSNGSYQNHYRRLPAKDRWRVSPNVLNTRSSMVCISEAGLYKLVMRSDKPEAQAFQDWVCGTVLPAIRKDGAYVMGEEKVASGEMSEDELVLRAIKIMENKVARLTAERDEAVKQRDTAHKVIGTHRHKLSRFARTLPGVNLNKIKQSLMDAGYLFKRGGAYNVYSKYRELFPTKIDETYGSVEVFVSEKGKKVLLDLHRKGKLILKKSAA